MSSVMNFPLDNPVKLRQALLEGDWGTTLINGELLFRLCPMCQAAVPPEFSDTTVTTPRLVHIQWHVASAEAMSRAMNRKKAK